MCKESFFIFVKKNTHDARQIEVVTGLTSAQLKDFSPKEFRDFIERKKTFNFSFGISHNRKRKCFTKQFAFFTRNQFRNRRNTEIRILGLTTGVLASIIIWFITK